MFSAEKLAKVLGTGAENVLEMAAGMGLRTPPAVNEEWLEKGYVSIIRANWHLLPYEQILQLLGWSEERLIHALKNEDFLFAKLGVLKPACPALKYEPLTDEEKKKTKRLCSFVEKHFPELGEEEPSFSFIKGCEPTAKTTSAIRRKAAEDEVAIDESWSVALEDGHAPGRTALYVNDFINIHKRKWSHALSLGSAGAKTITVAVRPDAAVPSESHWIAVESDSVAISAVDEFGAFRALKWIERKMDECGGPFLPLGKFSMETRFESRIAYPYYSSYGDPFMSDPEKTCPDSLLKDLSQSGINGIWLQCILHTMSPWELDLSLSKGWETRVKNLKDIANRAARYGIGVYLYLAEPRGVPTSFFEKHPEMKGLATNPAYGNLTTLCTSVPAVKSFLKESVFTLFTEIPELAGVFTITASDNPTSCHSKYNGSACPRCSKRSPQEVIAEVNSLIEEGVHRAKPSAKILAWSWGWRSDWEGGLLGTDDWAPGIIEKLPGNVEVTVTSEEGMPVCIGGISSYVKDYSISNVGPGERAYSLWEMARKRGLKAAAKVQLNNSWENASVPYIPVLNLVDSHLRNLAAADVRSLLVSWTLGGCPGTPNFLRLRDFIWKENASERSLADFAKAVYGTAAAPSVLTAWKLMSDAFKHFPHFISVLYGAPLHMGPANLLFSDYSGYRATMVTYPYDDLETWRSIYPESIFLEQFRKLSMEWQKGVQVLDKSERPSDEEQRKAFEDLLIVSRANYCHFRTTYLQAYFISQRNAFYINTRRYGIMERNEEGATTIENLLKTLREEIEIAKSLYALVNRDSRLGFESTQHYYYRTYDLMEKTLNCQSLIDHFVRIKNDRRNGEENNA